MGPKEDPADRAERERQRRAATRERADAAQKTAHDLTNDLRAVYGLRGLSMFAPRPAARAAAPAPIARPER